MNRTLVFRARALGLLVAAGVAMLAIGCVSVSTGPADQSTDASSSLPAVSSAPVSLPSMASDSVNSPKRRLKVPSSIDATGSRDVSDELEAFIRNAPNGSTIVFKAGGTYRLGNPLNVDGKKGITLEGNGATLKLTGPGNFDGAGIFVRQGSADTTIRNLSIVGNHSAAGTSDACCGRESQHAIGVFGSTNTLIEDVDISRVGGDCLYLSGHGTEFVWPDGVTFRDSTCRLTGRSGVSVDAGKNIRVANNTFDQIGFMVVNIEPNGSHGGANDVVIRNNLVRSYGLTDTYATYFFAACDAPWGGGSVVRNVTVTGNTVEASRSGWSGAINGLNTVVCGDDGPRANFTFTNNTAKGTVDGATWGVMEFYDVNSVTVTGNTQPLSGGSKLVTFTGSTNVTYEEAGSS
jgi:hypothetical protein